MTSHVRRASITGSGFTTPQEMLALSLASYRGFADTGASFIGRAAVRSSIESALDEWPPLQQWELAWGPAVHQTPLTLFDDDVVFVARHTVERRYAVVIRGTNPVDLLDWVLGDFLVANVLPWPLDAHGIPDVAVSVSTYRGLMYLVHMESGGLLDTAWIRLAAPAVDATRSALRRIVDAADPWIDRWLDDADEGAEAFARRTIRQRTRDLSPHARWQTMSDLWPGPGPPDARVGNLERALDWATVVAIDSGVFPQRLRPGGVSLVRYLAGEMAAVGDAEVIVTGHSKGGALAPVLALWLAQNQGTTPRRHDMWDPDGRATVSCHAFAGPTPGTAGFARLYRRVLGDRGHRYANRADLAPHAWAIDDPHGLDLTTVRRLYGGAIERSGGLTAVLEAIRRTVASTGYVQPGRHVVTLPGRARPSLGLAEQIVYQHLPAYVTLMGLRGVIDPFDIVV